MAVSQQYLAVQSAGKYAYAAWVARLGYTPTCRTCVTEMINAAAQVAISQEQQGR